MGPLVVRFNFPALRVFGSDGVQRTSTMAFKSIPGATPPALAAVFAALLWPPCKSMSSESAVIAHAILLELGRLPEAALRAKHSKEALVEASAIQTQGLIAVPVLPGDRPGTLSCWARENGIGGELGCEVVVPAGVGTVFHIPRPDGHSGLPVGWELPASEAVERPTLPPDIMELFRRALAARLVAPDFEERMAASMAEDVRRGFPGVGIPRFRQHLRSLLERAELFSSSLSSAAEEPVASSSTAVAPRSCEWLCAACTYLNSDTASRCEACEMARGINAPPPLVSLATSSQSLGGRGSAGGDGDGGSDGGGGGGGSRRARPQIAQQVSARFVRGSEGNAASPATLDNGWQEVPNTALCADGTPGPPHYYWNTLTGETQWERPRPAALPSRQDSRRLSTYFQSLAAAHDGDSSNFSSSEENSDDEGSERSGVSIGRGAEDAEHSQRDRYMSPPPFSVSTLEALSSAPVSCMVVVSLFKLSSRLAQVNYGFASPPLLFSENQGHGASRS